VHLTGNLEKLSMRDFADMDNAFPLDESRSYRDLDGLAADEVRAAA
jgi:hypothetical protein